MSTADPFERYMAGGGTLEGPEAVAAMAAAVRVLRSQLNQERQHHADDMKRMEEQALLLAAVIQVGERQVYLATADQGILVVPRPRGNLTPGMIVQTSATTGAIVSVETRVPGVGPLLKIARLLGEEGLVEVESADSAPRIVLMGADENDYSVGDEVLLDSTRSVIALNFGRREKVSDLAFTEDTGVTWDDIAGQEDAKRILRETVEGPVLEGELYREFGLEPCKGILLYGAPGNGKTLFCKAVASTIASRKGGNVSGFIYVKGPEVLHGIVGQSEGKIRKIFAAAREHHERHGYPAVVCLDEADAILGTRTDSKISMSQTIVPQFLAEMDGLDPSGALVILLTNRPDSLDPAVTRDGRIDVKIEVPRPGKVEATAILEYHLGKRLLAPGMTRESLAKSAVSEVMSPKHMLYMIRVHPGRGMDSRVTLERFVSGAMCAGLVNRATRLAIRRSKAGEGPRGIVPEDFEGAVKETVEGLKRLQHGAELRAVVDEMGGPEVVRRVEPL